MEKPMIPNPNANKWYSPFLTGLRFIAEAIFSVLVILAFCYPATLGYYAVACSSSDNAWSWALLTTVFFPIAFPVFGCLLVVLAIMMAIGFRPFKRFKRLIKYLSYTFLMALLLGLVSYGFSYALDASTKCNFGF